MIAVWDFGGVVCAFRPHRRLAALAELTGIDEATIDQRIWRNGLDAAAERGDLSPDEAWNGVLAALDHRADRDAVRGAWALAFEPNPAILALVDNVRVPAALFTNNGPIVDDVLDHELADIGRRFPNRLVSWRLGAIKPAPEAFQRAATQLGRDPNELLLLDDSPANVAAARAQGWQAALIQAG